MAEAAYYILCVCIFAGVAIGIFLVKMWLDEDKKVDVK